jgi:hypothetical protein
MVLARRSLLMPDGGASLATPSSPSGRGGLFWLSVVKITGLPGHSAQRAASCQRNKDPWVDVNVNVKANPASQSGCGPSVRPFLPSPKGWVPLSLVSGRCAGLL